MTIPVSIFVHRNHFCAHKPSTTNARILACEIGRVRREKRYYGTHGHHWWTNPHCATATNRTASGQDRTVSFGIRTVNPGFYSPGIEVYSVRSSPRPYALYPSRMCVWVMFNRRAARRLHISASLYGGREERRRGKRRKAAPPLGFVRCHLVCRCPWIVVDFSARSVILCLSCLRNETFLKNVRYILSPSFFPSVLRVLTGCPTNWIYRTVPLYRTPPLNVSLN